MANAPHASARQQVLQGFVGTDILPLAFKHLDNSELLNAALTCKGFSGPALDDLWRKMDSLDPLLSLVGSSKIEVFEKKQTSEKSRLDLYRKRIRILQLGPPPRPVDEFLLHEVKVKAVLEICHSLPNEKLLPSLMELEICASANSERNALIPFLLTHSLRQIGITGGRTPSPEQAFSLATTLSPNVEELSLRFGRESLDASVTKTFLLESLLSLKHLRSLTVEFSGKGGWTLRVSSVEHLLLCLPRLSHIDIAVNHIEYDRLSSVDKDTIVAPLASFELYYSPNQLNGLQLSHSFPFITRICLKVHPSLAMPEVALFIRGVASLPRLRSFIICGKASLEVGEVLPLFSSRTLQHVILDCHIFTHYRDEQTLESNVPQASVVDLVIDALKQNRGPLKNLDLGHSIDPMPTFDALMKFAECAPSLCELYIGVWLPPGSLDHLQSCSERRFENALQKLVIFNFSQPFSYDDNALLAKCIDSWFPNLDKVRCTEEQVGFPGAHSGIEKLRAQLQDARRSSALQGN
ncbi:hypothetical protein BKA70DRAFT_846142 [Coprinopsis sp. MPI-PUGE-AT-0042]|nr:hypothetical protein BKA70DRAFT_846142 [Coprinopsis sp. MPI-PUGE-AT-0042]